MTTILATDGYKFSMAEAGFPLRQETFHYTHRKGGWQYLPLDVEKFVRGLLPIPKDFAFQHLEHVGYTLGGAARHALTHGTIRVDALPAGSWFYEREPVFSVTGPSMLVSWLEPLVLQLHFRIQIATCALLTPERLPGMVANATCEREREIIAETLDAIRISCPPIEVRADYSQRVRARAQTLVDIVGDPSRLFEVGLRAATCSEQHHLALKGVADAGITKTSHVSGAILPGMFPVGTMGHEHVQRHGSDAVAYATMRDRHPGFVFYLPDTFDTLASGIPSALEAMLADPTRPSGIRFDSEHGGVGHYLYAGARAREVGLEPVLGLESGWDDEKTRRFEDLRERVGWPASKQMYGYGGWLVAPEWPTFTRDNVSAVWKISQTGDRATMKFGDEPNGGKSSIPGRPVVWRPHLGMSDYSGPMGYVAQEGEDWKPPAPASLLTGAESIPAAVRFQASELHTFTGRVEMSPATRALIDQCTSERAAGIALATTRSTRRL